MTERRVRKAVIPAAGLGTRFLPATKAQPKEMLPLVDKPTIQYVVEEAVSAGIEDILIITGRGKRAIEDHFDRATELENWLLSLGKGGQLVKMIQDISRLADIHFVRQKEPRGLGQAILTAKRHVGDEPFAVLLGDMVSNSHVPVIRQLMQEFRHRRRPVIGVTQVPWGEVGRYGIITPGTRRGRSCRITDLVEKPVPEEAPSNLAIAGRYILGPEIFPILEELKPGAGGEIQLTDALRVANQWGSLFALEVKGKIYDVGDKLGFLKATVEMALTRPDLGPEFHSYLTHLLAISSLGKGKGMSAGPIVEEKSQLVK
ncbi:MAG: UTP--glucose-1-phosphate uridylyltransferase GalU [Firmicutes bacterium]|nr:UTP--glucose-1-phosphate uridylyltransferase GalU [Bacillota bacterium]MCL5040613.1 UTP--glucose-1-phosphate uridylyltransferase GalU [Bacillota bacterium]